MKAIIFLLIIFSLFFINCNDTNNMKLLFEEKVNKTPHAITDSGSLEIVPFTGGYSAAENYDYYSNSAHIKKGPQPVAKVSKIYLFQGTDGLHLFFFHNCDDCYYPNTVNWTIVTRKNNLLDDYVVQDDLPAPAYDQYSVTTNSGDFSKEYYISQKYVKNSDGGVIGPFVDEDFTITIYIDDPGIIESTLVESANGETLVVTDEVTISL